MPKTRSDLTCGSLGASKPIAVSDWIISGRMTCEDYHAYLVEERKLAVRTVVQHVAAIRFLYAKTLRRRDMAELKFRLESIQRPRPATVQEGN
jgi:hypothetical protein